MLFYPFQLINCCTCSYRYSGFLYYLSSFSFYWDDLFTQLLECYRLLFIPLLTSTLFHQRFGSSRVLLVPSVVFTGCRRDRGQHRVRPGAGVQPHIAFAVAFRRSMHLLNKTTVVYALLVVFTWINSGHIYCRRSSRFFLHRPWASAVGWPIEPGLVCPTWLTYTYILHLKS